MYFEPSAQYNFTLRFFIFVGWQQFVPQPPSQRRYFSCRRVRQDVLGSTYMSLNTVPLQEGAGKKQNIATYKLIKQIIVK